MLPHALALPCALRAPRRARVARPPRPTTRRRRTRTSPRQGEPAREGEQPVPAPARPQPGRLVPVGAGGVRERRRRRSSIFLSIGYSSCHWCHVMERESFAERRGRQDPQRALRLHQGRSRGTAGRRRHLHDRPQRHRRAGRLAAVDVPHARRQADRRRHLLAARGQEGRRGHDPGLQDDPRAASSSSTRRNTTIWTSRPTRSPS